MQSIGRFHPHTQFLLISFIAAGVVSIGCTKSSTSTKPPEGSTITDPRYTKFLAELESTASRGREPYLYEPLYQRLASKTEKILVTKPIVTTYSFAPSEVNPNNGTLTEVTKIENEILRVNIVAITVGRATKSVLTAYPAGSSSITTTFEEEYATTSKSYIYLKESRYLDAKGKIIG